jgi:adenosylcobyric acid synthase
MLNIDLDDEDSLSPRLLNHDKPDACSIDIAVVRLRWLSNFTDMNELEHQPGVRIRYVEDPDFDGSPDALILPGTKNTMADLAWLRESGMEDRILEEKRRGTLIFGICGGYQLLGKSLENLTAGERGKKVKGLGLLPVETTFSERKIRRRTEAVVHPQTGIFGKLSGRKITGYEIHMGETVILGKPFLSARDAVSGDIYDDGCAEENVCGTYVHGFFDETEVSQAFLEILATRRGISWRSEGKESRIAYKEAQYDRLADSVRKALNMDLIYRIIEQGISD